MKEKLFVWLLIFAAVIGSVFVGLGRSESPVRSGAGVSENEAAREYLRFVEPREGTDFTGDKYKITIWTDKPVYRRGEPIRLYIELLKTAGRVDTPGLDLEEHLIQDPESLIISCACKLIMYKVDEEKFVLAGTRIRGDCFGLVPVSEYIVPRSEVKDPAVRARMRVPRDRYIFLNPDESVVVRLDNLADFLPGALPGDWCGNAPPHIYVERIRGVYKIQYICTPLIRPAPVGCSNIIEFEIR